MRLHRQTLFALVMFPFAAYLGIAAGFRNFGLGRDYIGYLETYNDIRASDALDVVRFEPGFVFSIWVAKFALGVKFQTFLSVLAGAALLVKFKVFSQHRRPILTNLFYLCCWYPLHEYTQIRAAVSLAFCLLASKFFFRRQFVAFALMMALAVSFHASALLVAAALPGSYFLSRFHLPVVIATLMAITVGLGAINTSVFSLASNFNPLVDNYVATRDDSQVNILSGINVLTVGLLGSILLSGSLKSRRDTTFFILAIVALASVVVFLATPVFSHRIKEMLMVFLVPLAFNTSLTKRALPQYAAATGLAIWSLYSAVSQGIIGSGA